MPRISKTLYFSLIIFGACFFLKEALVPYADYDLFLHLFMGRQIVEQQALPLIDTYSFTAAGSPVTDHEWLAQVIFYGLYSNFGDAGLFAFKILFSGVIALLIFGIISRSTENRLARVVSWILLLAALRSGLAFRVQMFSYLFLTLLIYLETINLSSRKKLIIYPLLFALWANLHGAFALGILVLAISAGAELLKSREWKNLIVPALAGAATLINPYGFGLYLYIIKELTTAESGRFITEWVPFSFQSRELAFFLAACLGLVGGFSQIKSRNYFATALLLIALFLGFSAVRNTPLIAVLCAGTVAIGLSFIIKEKAENRGERSLVWVSIAPAALAIFLLLKTDTSFKISLADDTYPVESVSYLKNNGLSGRIALPLHWGGYALLHLYPNFTVSIDGRWAMVYSPKEMQLSHDLAYNSEKGKWKKLAADINADYLLVESDNPAIPEMLEDRDWQVLVKESEAILLTHVNNS